MTCTNLDGEKWRAAQTAAETLEALGPILGSVSRGLYWKPKARVYQTEMDWEVLWVVSYYEREAGGHTRAIREFGTFSAAIEFAHASWYL